jgi:hypothetical protein
MIMAIEILTHPTHRRLVRNAAMRGSIAIVIAIVNSGTISSAYLRLAQLICSRQDESFVMSGFVRNNRAGVLLLLHA